jgi:tetratricopeptide (TPR) repeat protein
MIRQWTRLVQALSAAAMVLTSTAPIAAAQDHDHAVVTGERLGKAHFETSCTPEAQREFDRALTMLHSFFFPETVNTFTNVTKLDPSCAIAYWGIAISQRPNPLVGPFDDGVLQRGTDNVAKGLALGPKTPRERDWLRALSEEYRDFKSVDQETRSRNYAKAMERLTAAYPDDVEARIFYALALNEAWDHSDTTYADLIRAAKLLEPIARKYPEHPGIKHYIIHSYDFPPLARRGLAAADSYAALAPAAPHALHMPSHIYSMLGMWDASIEGNLKTVAAGRAYAASAKLDGVYPGDLHSYDFMQYAYLQQGRDDEARTLVETVGAITKVYTPRLSSETGQSAVPARYCLERQDWACAADLKPIGLSPAAEAITYFSRALGKARGAAPASAQPDLDKLGELRRQLLVTSQRYWVEQLDIQMLAVQAWVTLATGARDEALLKMRAAADREDKSEKHVAMENRLYPMRELLADMLLSTGDAAGALREYEASLAKAPARLRGLYGAAKAATAAGQKKKARDYFTALVKMTDRAGVTRPEVLEARAAVGRK